MIRRYRIIDRRLQPVDEPPFNCIICSTPDDAERHYLTSELHLDEHTLHSALDPDEVSRLEFEPEHTALIYKHPATYIAQDQFLFKVNSVGAFIFRDFLLFLSATELPIPDGLSTGGTITPAGLFLKIINRTITHFREHLRIISKIADELEDKISAALSNQHLIHLFALQKSLVYYVEALTSNHGVLERLRRQATRAGFTDEEIEVLEDTLIDNDQCLKQAEIATNILANLMDARVSIVSNNLNVLMKTLNIITIGIMVPTLVVSAFSMNVRIPLSTLTYAFWIIIGLAMLSAVGFWAVWRFKKW
ncbi:MAG: magnesium transporter CorA family protein [Calditrichaeota bacterium]|nr:magnesium transporter CorA family protein [Calditrichota bacterium]